LTASALEALQGLEPTRSELTGGVETFLHDVRGAGIRIGVATSSDGSFARWILERLAISSFIDAIVPADHPNLRGRYKPGPGPWQELWRELHVTNANRVVVVEDRQDALLGAMASHGSVSGVIIVPQGRTELGNGQLTGVSRGSGRILYRKDFFGLAHDVLAGGRRENS
jgi:beta-phosphoglucomutase-like phosphatase (HAD superfamily)